MGGRFTLLETMAFSAKGKSLLCCFVQRKSQRSNASLPSVVLPQQPTYIAHSCAPVFMFGRRATTPVRECVLQLRTRRRQLRI